MAICARCGPSPSGLTLRLTLSQLCGCRLGSPRKASAIRVLEELAARWKWRAGTAGRLADEVAVVDEGLSSPSAPRRCAQPTTGRWRDRVSFRPVGGARSSVRHG